MLEGKNQRAGGGSDRIPSRGETIFSNRSKKRHSDRMVFPFPRDLGAENNRGQSGELKKRGGAEDLLGGFGSRRRGEADFKISDEGGKGRTHESEISMGVEG